MANNFNQIDVVLNALFKTKKPKNYHQHSVVRNSNSDLFQVVYAFKCPKCSLQGTVVTSHSYVHFVNLPSISLINELVSLFHDLIKRADVELNNHDTKEHTPTQDFNTLEIVIDKVLNKIPNYAGHTVARSHFSSDKFTVQLIVSCPICNRTITYKQNYQLSQFVHLNNANLIIQLSHALDSLIQLGAMNIASHISLAHSSQSNIPNVQGVFKNAASVADAMAQEDEIMSSFNIKREGAEYRIPFGKYRGQLMKDVDDLDYLQFMVNSSREFIKQVESELRRRERLEEANTPLIERLINRGFKELVKENHPDATGKDSTIDMADLKASRDILKELLKQLEAVK